MPAEPSTAPDTPRAPLKPSWLRKLQRHAAHPDPTIRALMWSASAGLLFCLLNTLARSLTLLLDPLQVQFLR